MAAIGKRTAFSRSNTGASITELLVTVVLLSFVMAMLSQLAATMTVASIKMNNKVDGLESARIAMNRISADVRQARSIGDFYGGGSKFPATTNPIYGQSRTPVGGWPGPPWDLNMKLSEQILVLQVPVFYEDPLNPSSSSNSNPYNGYPIMLPKGFYDGGGVDPPANMENLDTIVYEVVADPSRVGEYLLQVARFPGIQNPNLQSKTVAAINPPQTILKGLVGPKGGSNTAIPSVFSYFGRTNGSGTFNRIVPNLGNLATGVGVDLEIKKTGLTAATGDGRFPEFFAIHQEAFLGSNYNTALNNKP